MENLTNSCGLTLKIYYQYSGTIKEMFFLLVLFTILKCVQQNVQMKFKCLMHWSKWETKIGDEYMLGTVHSKI